MGHGRFFPDDTRKEEGRFIGENERRAKGNRSRSGFPKFVYGNSKIKRGFCDVFWMVSDDSDGFYAFFLGLGDGYLPELNSQGVKEDDIEIVNAEIVELIGQGKEDSAGDKIVPARVTDDVFPSDVRGEEGYALDFGS